MREILFRGQRTDNKEWVYGNLFIPDREDSPTEILIGTNVIRISYEVSPKTVGQYTGLKDKNGTKIFEGDIVLWEKKKSEIKMRKGVWAVFNDKHKLEYDEWDFLNIVAKEVEIIGNIHDNPELLKELNNE